MKFNFEETKIYVRSGATDLRKGVGGLLAVIENEMKLDALTDSVFLFCNKSHKLLKFIFWDKTGFWLAQKRLERNTWPWPDNSEEARQITPEQIEMLLCGIDFWHAHEEIKFSSVF